MSSSTDAKPQQPQQLESMVDVAAIVRNILIMTSVLNRFEASLANFESRLLALEAAIGGPRDPDDDEDEDVHDAKKKTQ